jgi:hypothetical protein
MGNCPRRLPAGPAKDLPAPSATLMLTITPISVNKQEKAYNDWMRGEGEGCKSPPAKITVDALFLHRLCRNFCQWRRDRAHYRGRHPRKGSRAARSISRQEARSNNTTGGARAKLTLHSIVPCLIASGVARKVAEKHSVCSFPLFRARGFRRSFGPSPRVFHST